MTFPDDLNEAMNRKSDCLTCAHWSLRNREVRPWYMMPCVICRYGNDGDFISQHFPQVCRK